jgi:hypothetical protein
MLVLKAMTISIFLRTAELCSGFPRRPAEANCQQSASGNSAAFLLNHGLSEVELSDGLHRGAAPERGPGGAGGGMP